MPDSLVRFECFQVHFVGLSTIDKIIPIIWLTKWDENGLSMGFPSGYGCEDDYLAQFQVVSGRLFGIFGHRSRGTLTTVPGSAELMRVAADRLSVRWYLGYDLHESLPDHSNLIRTRERFGLSVFRRFFERIVEECIQAGLVRGDELFFDSTKVEGDAAVDSLAPRWAVEAHLGELFEKQPPVSREISTADDTSPTAPPTAPSTLLTADDADLREKNALKRNWISRNGAQDRTFKGGSRQRTSDTRASTTDPDATPMTWFKGGRSLGYQTHYVVDGAKARVIVGVLVTPSEVTENRPMLDLLWRAVFRWRMRPHHVTGDGKYGTAENVAVLEKAGIRGGHSSLRRLTRERFQARLLRQERVSLRPAQGCLRVSGGRAPASGRTQ